MIKITDLIYIRMYYYLGIQYPTNTLLCGNDKRLITFTVVIISHSDHLKKMILFNNTSYTHTHYTFC